MSGKMPRRSRPHLYPALNVMRNRLGIRQAQRLEQTARKSPPACGDAAAGTAQPAGYPLCFIHHQLYQDIFDWAGNSEKSISIRGYSFLPFCVD